ncbi:plasmolipin isoform X2 [Gopherus evgoodei]|uniref:plasmolipin isoform X2 n=1 Tax=Gopherus evgoodei TaxID=1825980 RepID=UPI0011CFBC34|nr:plasmolipin isoform X2 [Gopherus evgoodei]
MLQITQRQWQRQEETPGSTATADRIITHWQVDSESLMNTWIRPLRETACQAVFRAFFPSYQAPHHLLCKPLGQAPACLPALQRGFLQCLRLILPLPRADAPVFTQCAQVLGLLVWALIASTYYQPIPAYGWVMFVAIFFWLVTVILFVMYLLQLQMKLYMIPWSVVFFACVVMIAYGASTFFSFQAWKGFGSNAATSQVTV